MSWQDPRWGAPITPVNPMDRQDAQAGSTLRQDGPGEVDDRQGRIHFL